MPVQSQSKADVDYAWVYELSHLESYWQEGPCLERNELLRRNTDFLSPTGRQTNRTTSSFLQEIQMISREVCRKPAPRLPKCCKATSPLVSIAEAITKAGIAPKRQLLYTHNCYLDPDTKVGFIIGSQCRNTRPIIDATGANVRMLGVGSGQHNP